MERKNDQILWLAVIVLFSHGYILCFQSIR